MSERLKELIAQVRLADKAYDETARIDESHEPVLWADKVEARRDLRSGIYDVLGVNIDDLKELTCT